MKPAPFEYWAPTSVDEAVKILSGLDDPGDAKVMAGGQSLMPLLNLRLSQPLHVVDLNAVGGMSDISRDGSTLTIGALCRQRTAERSADVAAAVPLVVEALGLVGHPAIRNRGTIGGSIAHADPAAEMPAVALCLDARMVAQGPGGERTVAASDFFDGFLSTALSEDEVLTAVRFPVDGPGCGAAFVEVARRHGDFAMAGVAAHVRLEGDVIAEARIAVSGVGLTPVRATGAEAGLRGAAPGDDAFAAAAAATSAALHPATDVHASGAYRKHVAGVLVRRALGTATDRARGNR
ncbi:FAD binding domain-containing protein [Pseudonocardia broussonetiae]|uniref:Xanthine dehydrogenase family protein subunit M n=1 Tax=Pseudonocardia broussonetiae TaxID=2736640 RepID=A0A6M6JP00_9PSEU|nr:xanthine dehydrogenase family protein subunit M [Pseudonocardia broussonetiae]QJY49658.1 xanthine dehydrogenase family protein subunit M [Pseudonocardia broussonetiae]